MITLIEKKDKDKRLLKNWRPISLINMDVKIASKVMAMRLESILPFLVHHSQNAFIKGRSIFDAIRTIDDILEYAKINSRTGILVAIDFEKAFDSLNRTFLVKVLQKFNFGTYFLQWIRTFYKNLSSCVLNNGFTTNFFSVSRAHGHFVCACAKGIEFYEFGAICYYERAARGFLNGRPTLWKRSCRER